MEHSFCEAGTAGPFSKWHIRELTTAGRKLGGGADTKSLCDKRVSWDLNTEICEDSLKNKTCKKCAELFKQKS